MAIGDAISVIIGTATTNRQPSSGVEEQISSIMKPNGTDACAMYNGSAVVNIAASGARTDLYIPDASAWSVGGGNLAIMLTNSVYFRKVGTTDYMWFGGVQTNA